MWALFDRKDNSAQFIILLNVDYVINNHVTNSDTFNVFTGSDGLYFGPTCLLGPYFIGFVRARAWVAADMPQTVMNSSVFMSSKFDL